MGRIVVDWDRESGKAEYRIEDMTHVEAQRVMLLVAIDCVSHALVEVHGHDHGEEAGGNGHKFYGYRNRGERERGGV